MTKEKLKSIFAFYRAGLDHCWPSVAPRQLREDRTKLASSDLATDEKAAHYKFMCDEACRFVDADRIEKAMRWLGFLQGVLWSTRVYSLDDLKNHSRPDEDKEAS